MDFKEGIYDQNSITKETDIGLELVTLIEKSPSESGAVFRGAKQVCFYKPVKIMLLAATSTFLFIFFSIQH